MKQTVLIPTLNPDTALLNLVDKLSAVGFERIIVINDGSTDDFDIIFDQLGNKGCLVIHHPQNRGKGAAIKTGMITMRGVWPDTPAILTLDGDGQHSVGDAERLAHYSEAHSDALVLGVRDLRGKEVPLRSRLGARFSSAYLRISTGVSCRDTQTGLRCIPASLFDRAQNCEGDRYDYEMNFLYEIANLGIPIVQLPINTIYENNNEGSHFRPVQDSLLIYRHLVRYTASSVICALVDLTLFGILAELVGVALGVSVALAVFLATVGARTTSGLLNFWLNRHWSFRAKNQCMSLQMGRYLMLFLAQMMLSAAGVAGVAGVSALAAGSLLEAFVLPQGSTDASRIAAVDSAGAQELSEAAYKSGAHEGFELGYRYRVIENSDGSYLVVFLDRGRDISAFYSLVRISLLVAGVAWIAVGVLLGALSGRAVAPIAEAYARQRRFITDASHDLKTPLAVISSSADVIELENGTSEWTNTIHEQVARMSELVNKLVLLSRMDEGERSLVISEVQVKDMLDTIASEFGAPTRTTGHSIEVSCESSVVCWTDASLLHQAMSLPVDNALKYAPENTAVTLYAGKKSRNRVQISVSNIAPNLRDGGHDELFDRFYRSDQARTCSGGHGIGLAVVRAIVQVHDGSVHAKVENGTLHIMLEFENRR